MNDKNDLGPVQADPPPIFFTFNKGGQAKLLVRVQHTNRKP